MRKLVIISGRTCSGKSGLAKRLASEHEFVRFQTSKVVAEIATGRQQDTSRQGLQEFGDILDQETKGHWLYERVMMHWNAVGIDGSLVVDNVRTESQLKHFRNDQNLDVVHVHLYAPTHELQKRLAKKLKTQEVGHQKFQHNDILKEETDI